MKKFFFMMMFVIFISVLPIHCQAMQVTSAKEIAEFNTEPLLGTVPSIRTRGQWDEYIRFNFYMPEDLSGKVYGSMLVAGNKNNLAFTFLPNSVIKVFEIKTSAPDKVFWLLKDVSTVDHDRTGNFYLVGPYKDHYETFISMDNLSQMGWNNTKMKARLLDTPDSTPVLQGYDYDDNLKQNIVLHWDEAAEWFSMENAPLNTAVQKIPSEG